MDWQRDTTRRLHDEHEATLAWVGRLEGFLGSKRWNAPSDEDKRLLLRVAGEIEREIERHFTFEETELFPRIAASGEGDIASILEEEHETIRAVGATLVGLARGAAKGTLATAEFQSLRTSGLELSERMVVHIQKEEMALLPAIEDALDDAADRALVLAYPA